MGVTAKTVLTNRNVTLRDKSYNRDSAWFKQKTNFEYYGIVFTGRVLAVSYLSFKTLTNQISVCSVFIDLALNDLTKHSWLQERFSHKYSPTFLNPFNDGRVRMNQFC